MNHKTFKINRIIAVMLLSSIFTFAFVWTQSSASEQQDKDTQGRTPSAESPEKKTSAGAENGDDRNQPEAVSLRAEKRGFPLLNLQDGKRLRTKFIGAEGDAESFGSSQAQPRAMTDFDLNADGASDLIVGYASSGGGHLALYQGNPDSLSARTPEIFEGIKEGRFPAPFLPEAR